MRSINLFSLEISETDPQVLGLQALDVKPLSDDSKDTAYMINKFIEQAKIILSPRETANMILLRGFSKLPNLPDLPEIDSLDMELPLEKANQEEESEPSLQIQQ